MRAAELLPALLTRAAMVRTLPGITLAAGEVRCVKCQKPTTRRLDRDVGVHEECEQR